MKSVKKYKRILIGCLIVVFFIILILAIDKINPIIEYTNIINAGKKYESALPQAFKSEFLDLDSVGAKDIKSAKDNKIVGFSINGSANDVFSLLKNKLEENNWIYVDTEQQTNASFYRQDGEYKWLFLNCNNFDNTCSVVMTIN